MKITPPDPLSSEERALATLLARMAPHGVPSPEIDATILSASHDAVASTAARSRRPRWPVAMGLAASMVLAVGVAWQLRPTQPEAADLEAASVQVLSSVEAPAASPPAVQAVAPSDPLNDATGDSAAAPLPDKSMEPPGPQAPPAVVAAPKAAPAEPLTAPVRAPPAPPAPAAPAYTASPPPAPPTGAVERKSTTSEEIQRLESARQADTAMASSETDSAVDATTAARRELRVAPSSERVQGNATASESGATRARRTDLQVPVAADAQLQVGDWLERVRTRYGLGDEAAARRSLLLFVQDHPTEAVPDDLEPLLDE